MPYEMLFRKKEQLNKIRSRIPKEALSSYEKSFEIEYAHHSTAIEGNTLTLIQTKVTVKKILSAKTLLKRGFCISKDDISIT